MKFKTPKFWYKPHSPVNLLLYPISLIYLLIKKINSIFIFKKKLPITSICVGNAVMGGAGKTPTVSAIALLLKMHGHNPHIISRGYGGNIVSKNPIKVSEKHNAFEVGEEALILRKYCPVWVGSDRIRSSQQAKNNGASIVISDDGLQNNAYIFDLNILVVDELQKFGNGRIFPCGPLRESIKSILKKIDAYVCQSEIEIMNSIPFIKINPKYQLPKINSKKIIAFSGIGYPEKFLKSLISIGYSVKKFYEFPDHHKYKENEIKKIIKESIKNDMPVITTEKDFVKIPLHLKKNINVLGLSFEISEYEILSLLKKNKIL